MNILIKPGRLFFALGIMGLAVVNFIVGDFIVGRPPAWPASCDFNPALAYIAGGLLIIACIAILLRKKAALAALLIGVLILLLSVPRHLAHFMDNWGGALKSLALFGGALIAACSFFKKDGDNEPGFLSKKTITNCFICVGIILVAAFFIGCGVLHFQYPDFVANFTPAYIPFRHFWAYFCAIALFAGGIGILIKPVRRLAAILSGVMVLGWFILLHIPRALADPHNMLEWMGVCESLAFAGIFFILADLFSEREAPGKIM